MTLGGKLTTLYSFCPALRCTDGAAPTGLVQGGDGNFYGTTSVAANSNGGYGGTIFSMSPGGEIRCCTPSAPAWIAWMATSRTTRQF